jgi:hypothetical protein
LTQSIGSITTKPINSSSSSFKKPDSAPGKHDHMQLFTAHMGEETGEKETLFDTDAFAIEFTSKKQTFFQSVRIKKKKTGADLERDDDDDDGDENQQPSGNKNPHMVSSVNQSTVYQPNESTETSANSVYYEGFQMRLHRQVRMYCCRRHKVTLIAASVRYNDFTLAEYIVKQVKVSSGGLFG